jgi:hypothetical protein
LKYNPDEPLIYQNLGWIFQHKMGADLDDAHLYYKSEWARQMDELLHGSNYQPLINPQTDDEKERARTLREKYKLDPLHMKAVDDEFGPLEWRLPESHAIYWATLGLQRAKKEEQITLRRETYQPLLLAFQRGRLIEFKVGDKKKYDIGPNLAMIPNANKAYEKAMAEDAEYRQHIATAHRNFLKDAVYFLYTHNRRADAQQWKDYLVAKYPDALIFDARSDSKTPQKIADMTLQDYCASRLTEDVSETSRTRVQQAIEGFLERSYFHLAIGENDYATGYALFASDIWNHYQTKVTRKGTTPDERVALPALDFLKGQALKVFDESYDPFLVAQLHTKLGLPAPTNAPPSTPTNAPPSSGPSPNP